MNQNKSNEVQIAGPLTGTVHWWECEIKDNRNDMIILDEEVHKWMLDMKLNIWQYSIYFQPFSIFSLQTQDSGKPGSGVLQILIPPVAFVLQNTSKANQWILPDERSM